MSNKYVVQNQGRNTISKRRCISSDEIDTQFERDFQNMANFKLTIFCREAPADQIIDAYNSDTRRAKHNSTNSWPDFPNIEIDAMSQCSHPGPGRMTTNQL